VSEYPEAFKALERRHVGNKAVGKTVKSCRNGVVVYTDGTFSLFRQGVADDIDVYRLVGEVISKEEFEEIIRQEVTENEKRVAEHERREYERLRAKLHPEAKP
jgi:hypothetical protein